MDRYYASGGESEADDLGMSNTTNTTVRFVGSEDPYSNSVNITRNRRTSKRRGYDADNALYYVSGDESSSEESVGDNAAAAIATPQIQREYKRTLPAPALMGGGSGGAKPLSPSGIQRKPKNPRSSQNSILYFVIVLDFDETLVDKNSIAYPGAVNFVNQLDNLPPHRSTGKRYVPLKVLWSLGSHDYVTTCLAKEFSGCRFDLVKTGSKSSHKGIVELRYDLFNLNANKYLQGPSVIVDDREENLRKDQYDVAVDVKRYYVKRGQRVADVNYTKLLMDVLSRVYDLYRQ